jgi:hypothetical protein
VPDLGALELLLEKLIAEKLVISVWHEPDFNGELTAIAIEPGRSSRLLANLPLTLREPAMA